MRTEEKDKTIIDEKNDNVSEGTLKDDDYDGIGFDVDAPPEICELCKEDKLRERLEHLKNQNHALRKILQECTCTNDEIDKHQQESSSTRSVGIYKTETDILAWKENTSELISAVKLLQSKCRTKDGMIAALANELKETASEEETLKILKNLADPEIRKRAVDFDRVTLWKYLEAGRQIRPSVSGQSEQIHRKDLSIGILVLILVSLSALVQFDAYVARFIRNCFYFALVHAHQTFQILLYLLPSYTTILENIYWFTLISYRIIYPLLITTISFIKLHPILAFYGFILLNFILLSLADRYGHSICQRVSSSRRMLLKTIDSIDKSLVFAALGLLLEFSFSFFVFEFARERFFLVFLPPQAPVLFYFMRRAFSNYKLPEMLTLGELPKSPLIYCVAYVSCFALGYVDLDDRKTNRKTQFGRSEVRLRVKPVGTDSLLVTWQTTKFDPDIRYQICIDEEPVSQVSEPGRTETTVHGLDLSKLRSVQIRAIDRSNRNEVIAETLYYPLKQLL